MALEADGLSRNQGSTRAASNSHREVRLHTDLIPQPLFYEGAQRLGPTLDYQRLDAMSM